MEGKLDHLAPGRRKAMMMSYCLKKGIKIYLKVITNTTGRVDAEDSLGRVTEGKVIYNISKKLKKGQPKWSDAIHKGYEYYYNKLNQLN